MSEAVKQYGPDAVDLALMAYRVEAAQQVLHGVVLLAVAAATAILYAKLWTWSAAKMEGGYGDEPYYIARVLCGILGTVCFLLSGASAMARLLDVSAWLATFGWPELRIAMKALEAAGLM